MSDKLIQFYENHVEKYDNDVRSLAWGSRESQEKRFEIFSKHLELSTKSVLDVGCGLGDFKTYLGKNNIDCEYIGIDITKSMIDIAKKNHPDCRFYVGDIRQASLSNEKPDFVVASGIFNLTIEDHENFIWDSIKTMFDLAKVGIAFNIMSVNAPIKNDDNFYADPVEYLEKCLEISKFSMVDHTYMIHDFTVVMYKNEK